MFAVGAAVVLSVSIGVSPVCTHEHGREAVQTRQPPMQADTGRSGYEIEMMERSQRMVQQRFEELQWHIDKTRQETETLQTQLRLRGLN